MSSHTHAASVQRSIRILVAGSANMDMIGFVKHHPGPEEHVWSYHNRTMAGGHGANQAVACMRMSHHRPQPPAVTGASPSVPTSVASPMSPTGSNTMPRRLSLENAFLRNATPGNLDVQVSLVAAVGDDDHGRRIREALRENGVDISGIIKAPSGVPTGSATIYIDAAAVPKITGAMGANAHLTPATIPSLSLSRAGRPDVVLVQLEIPRATVQHVVRLARAEGVPVIFNAAPYDTVPDDLYDVDHFIVNASQADRLMGLAESPLQPAARRGSVDVEGDAGVSDGHSFIQGGGVGGRHHAGPSRLHVFEHYLAVCRELHELGARTVVVTLGEFGAVGSQRDAHGRTSYCIREAARGGGGLTGPGGGPATAGGEPPPRPQDTTGASDAFIGAYAVELAVQTRLTGRFDLSAALETGVRAGGLTVNGIGSMESIPWREDVENGVFNAVEV